MLGPRDFLGRAVTLGLGAAAPLLPGARAPASAAADTTAKRDVVVLQTSDLTALDPHASTYASDCRVSFSLFDTLVKFTPDPAQQLELRRFNFRLRRG